MDIVFMGTPVFAAASLSRLLDEGHRVLAVFSQPDKPSGRGYKVLPPPVKELAASRGIPVYQPATLRDGEAAKVIAGYAPAAVVVVAYGKILPKGILDIPPLGCINLHGSLLPRYRGAAPIQWSVINGDTSTGVTSMYMAEGMDTGDMILKCETPIGPDETAPELSARLAQLGAQCLADTLRLLGEGRAPRTPQDPAAATLAPMLGREMGLLDFSRDARALHNLARGLAGWPAAFTYSGGRLLKIHRTALLPGEGGAPGEILRDKRLVVACGEGALELLEVQPQGKAIMAGEAYMRGRRLKKGDELPEAAPQEGGREKG